MVDKRYRQAHTIGNICRLIDKHGLFEAEITRAHRALDCAVLLALAAFVAYGRFAA